MNGQDTLVARDGILPPPYRVIDSTSEEDTEKGATQGQEDEAGIQGPNGKQKFVSDYLSVGSVGKEVAGSQKVCLCLCQIHLVEFTRQGWYGAMRSD